MRTWKQAVNLIENIKENKSDFTYKSNLIKKSVIITAIIAMRRLSSSIMDSYIIRYFHPHTQPNSQSYYTGFVKPLVHLPNGLISYTIKNLNLCNIFKHFSLTKGVTHLSSISFFVYFIIPNSLAYQYLNKKMNYKPPFG